MWNLQVCGDMYVLVGGVGGNDYVNGGYWVLRDPDPRHLMSRARERVSEMVGV